MKNYYRITVVINNSFCSKKYLPARLHGPPIEKVALISRKKERKIVLISKFLLKVRISFTSEGASVRMSDGEKRTEGRKTYLELGRLQI